MLLEKKPVIRAIDVGYGRVKYSYETISGMTEFGIFPSFALPSETLGNNLYGSRIRDTHRVPTSHSTYEVGVDICLALKDENFGRTTDDEVHQSDVYEALTKGAMAYMWEKGDRVIDVLVLGLSLDRFNNFLWHKLLTSRFRGNIDLGEGRRMQVREVSVQVQLIGAYVSLQEHLRDINNCVSAMPGNSLWIDEFDTLESNTVLQVDAGENALDWILVQRGTVVERVSGTSKDGGRQRISHSVKTTLASKFGDSLGSAVMSKIDDVLESGNLMKLVGKFDHVDSLEAITMAEINASVDLIVDALKGAREAVDLIALGGDGYLHRYAKSLALRFPSTPTFVLPMPAAANVRGFQKIGSAMFCVCRCSTIH